MVFFFGVFWKRLNAQGCPGDGRRLHRGVFRMLVDTPCTLNPNFHYAEGSFFWIVNNINFQYFSIPHHDHLGGGHGRGQLHDCEPNQAQIKGLTFATATAEDKAKTRESWGMKEVVFSAIVMVCITFAYLYFRG